MRHFSSKTAFCLQNVDGQGIFLKGSGRGIVRMLSTLVYVEHGGECLEHSAGCTFMTVNVSNPLSLWFSWCVAETVQGAWLRANNDASFSHACAFSAMFCVSVKLTSLACYYQLSRWPLPLGLPWVTGSLKYIRVGREWCSWAEWGMLTIKMLPPAGNGPWVRSKAGTTQLAVLAKTYSGGSWGRLHLVLMHSFHRTALTFLCFSLPPIGI